jgi:outer membrane protein assembly factor BamE (lipoprotein component of BamABCDE complex)
MKKTQKQLTAALKLKSKMETIDTIGATAATASAIAKATKINSDSQSQNLQSKLRISNHKKSLRKQDQKK